MFPADLLLVVHIVKNLPATQEMQETQVQSLGWEYLLEKGKATHSSILAWRIPWTAEPGGLQSMGSHRVGHDWATNTFFCTFIVYHTTVVCNGAHPWPGALHTAVLCLTLHHPVDYSLPGSSVHGGILQARILSGLLFPPPGDLSNPGIKLVSPALAGGFFTAEPLGKPMPCA